MLNKILALLLSAGLLLSPLNAADSPLAASDELTANVPITVGKQQAVWEKHYTRIDMIDGYEISWEGGIQVTGDAYTTGYLDYEIDNTDGTVHGVGSQVYIPYNEGTTIYIVYSPLQICQITRTHYENYLYLIKKMGVIGAAKVPTEVMGDYVSNVTADVGSFPQDGKHADGYWYVFKGLVED